MGKINSGINLTKKVFIRTCENNSLCSKQLKNINASELGYCLPNGNINFQTEEAALKYIKNRLLASLNGEQQFERCIAKRDTRILSETNGSKNHCDLPFNGEEFLERISDKAVRDVEIWHSHPDEYGIAKAPPLSPPEGGDLATFNELHLKKIVAMNSKGEINSMEVLPSYSSEMFNEFRNKFDDFVGARVIKLLPEKLQHRIEQITKILMENKGTSIPQELKNELKYIEQLQIKSQSKGEFAQIMHDYYKTADQYGMRYYTNFSNLA
ncbi:hypothetical protein HDR58_09095 [bacterium]|nr:hypothetical protein [bacterium]